MRSQYAIDMSSPANNNMYLIQDSRSGKWLRWQGLREVVSVSTIAGVLPALQYLESAVNHSGLTAAGFLSYEAAPAFDAALRCHPPGDFPLLWFGLFEKAVPFELPPATGGGYRLTPWRPSVSKSRFAGAVTTIREHIARGESYQVNYTYRLRSTFAGDGLALLSDLHSSQRGRFGAYLDTGEHIICSISPECFFTLDGTTLVSMPMKGTVKRGPTLDADRERAEWLRNSEKNQAENVMIVDMIRNDMGRIAISGSVRVPSLFDLARYPTLWQMTSTVTAETEAPVTDIFSAMFPCASITGAPKVATMRIIHELESAPRGIYTGAIGYIAPDRQAQFSVAIRTVQIDRATGRAVYGVGSGIVWDSEAESEYAECRTKSRILTMRLPPIGLLETMRWQPGSGYYLLDRHCSRLRRSAEYFDIPLDEGALQRRLAEFASTLQELSRVRLLVDEQGAISLEATALPAGEPEQPARLALAREPVQSSSRFLYHKTTRREAYEDAYRRAQAENPAVDDVLLWNERGEVTESTIANLVLEIDGRLVTPPLSSGLLPGTMRAELLEQGIISEQVVRVEDLSRASAVWLVNSVRQWRRAVIIATDAGAANRKDTAIEIPDRGRTFVL